ncbi:MAG: cytochrome C oxidase subunit IV family protein [Planctomycetes bacterium]|nr:cytochrome C oxidase subunit IV family protein [Planctomycetota bacterium]NUQ35079.1 cytochrome C oxidase subunit IV family protein [Planctomycetaceae bacterium]
MSKHDEHHTLGHVMPASTLINVFLALIVLTVVTVAVAQKDLGPLNVWVALFIASIKGSIVCAYFMHLKYDKKLNLLIFGISVVLVLIMITFTIVDSHFYYNNIDSYQQSETFQAAKAAAASSAAK